MARNYIQGLAFWALKFCNYWNKHRTSTTFIAALAGYDPTLFAALDAACTALERAVALKVTDAP